jgi:uncharacterized protein DUF1259
VPLRPIAAALLALVVLPRPVPAQLPGPGWDSVGAVLGAAPTFTDAAVRYSFPRADLKVRVGDVPIEAGLALGSWAGFTGPLDDALMLGDLVLTEAELPPILDHLRTPPLTASAVHNHLVGEAPSIIYVHFQGRGPASQLARRLREALDLTGTPSMVPVGPPVAPVLDTARIFQKLGLHGSAGGKLARAAVALLPGPVTVEGREVPPALGLLSPISFQAAGPNRVVATGDFALGASQVSAVMAALGEHGIRVTAAHSHMLGEQPAITFVHFWGDGAADDVAAGLAAAIQAAREASRR